MVKTKLGAVIGDIAGSQYEWDNCKSKDCELFSSRCFPTDDSVMTIAIGAALLEADGDYKKLGKLAVENMRSIGLKYMSCGYGASFMKWLKSEHPAPYKSYGNGAAMRVSLCGHYAESIDEAKELARKVTEVTHNHPEALKGAESVAVAVYLAKEGKAKEEIRDYITKNYYDIDFTLDEIREEYRFDVSCQGSVPQAFEAFFESEDFEDALRNAISIGGDSDTIAAITCAVAGAYYEISEELYTKALSFLDNYLFALAMVVTLRI